MNNILTPDHALVLDRRLSIEQFGTFFRSHFGGEIHPMSQKHYARLTPKDADEKNFIEIVQLAGKITCVIANIANTPKVLFHHTGNRTIRLHFQVSGELKLNASNTSSFVDTIPKFSIINYDDDETSLDIYEQSRETKFLSIFLPADQLAFFLNRPLEALLENKNTLLTELEKRSRGFVNLITDDLKTIFDSPSPKANRLAILPMAIWSAFSKCINIFDNLLSSDAVSVKSVHLGDSDKFMLAREILAEDLLTNYTLGTLAKKVGMNRSKLSFGFKKLFNITIADFVIERKMQLAAEKLCKSNDQIAEIAYDLGFKHPSNFTASFKRHFGASPRAIRNRAKAA